MYIYIPAKHLRQSIVARKNYNFSVERDDRLLEQSSYYPKAEI